MNNKRYDETSAQSIELYAKQLQNKRLIDFIEKPEINKQIKKELILRKPTWN